MDKNVDLCSAVECIAAHPRLTKSPEEEEKYLYVFFCIGASISIRREIRCLPYAGFLNKILVAIITKYEVQCSAVQPNAVWCSAVPSSVPCVTTKTPQKRL